MSTKQRIRALERKQAKRTKPAPDYRHKTIASGKRVASIVLTAARRGGIAHLAADMERVLREMNGPQAHRAADMLLCTLGNCLDPDRKGKRDWSRLPTMRMPWELF